MSCATRPAAACFVRQRSSHAESLSRSSLPGGANHTAVQALCNRFRGCQHLLLLERSDGCAFQTHGTGSSSRFPGPPATSRTSSATCPSVFPAWWVSKAPILPDAVPPQTSVYASSVMVCEDEHSDVNDSLCQICQSWSSSEIGSGRPPITVVQWLCLVRLIGS